MNLRPDHPHASGRSSRPGRTGRARGGRAWLARCLALLGFLAVLAGPRSPAAMEGNRLAAAANVIDLKASYLTKLPLFITWPDGVFSDRNAPVIIGILGDDPFGPAFDSALRSMRADGRGYEVRRFTALGGVEACHILYIGRSEQGRLAEILKAVRSLPLLTIGDFPGFALGGGMFNFILEEGRVRFECNREAVRRGGLKVSGKLLQISRIVREEGAGAEP